MFSEKLVMGEKAVARSRGIENAITVLHSWHEWFSLESVQSLEYLIQVL